jgi:hypothetical protein
MKRKEDIMYRAGNGSIEIAKAHREVEQDYDQKPILRSNTKQE